MAGLSVNRRCLRIVPRATNPESTWRLPTASRRLRRRVRPAPTGIPPRLPTPIAGLARHVRRLHWVAAMVKPAFPACCASLTPFESRGNAGQRQIAPLANSAPRWRVVSRSPSVNPTPLRLHPRRTPTLPALPEQFLSTPLRVVLRALHRHRPRPRAARAVRFARARLAGSVQLSRTDLGSGCWPSRWRSACGGAP